jgi:hypothetical protein
MTRHESTGADMASYNEQRRNCSERKSEQGRLLEIFWSFGGFDETIPALKRWRLRSELDRTRILQPST